jgi:uncharacterized RDD family membrane protein YckC
MGGVWLDTALRPGEKYAGFWVRFLASVVDSIIVSVIIGPIANAVYDKPDATASLFAAAQSGDIAEMVYAIADATRPAGVGDFVLNIVVPAAAIVMFWIYRSATPGKMVTRTRIVDSDTGEPPSTKQCVVRYLGYFASMLPLFLGFFWVAFDKRKQGWHDKIAGTLVVQSPKPAA